MKKIVTIILSIIFGIGLFIGIAFVGNYIGLWNYSYFAPKYESARRNVYENTQSYVEGKRQSLTNYYEEFRNAEPNEKRAIRKLMLQDFSNFDISQLNSTQYGWYKEMVNYN